MMNSSKIRSEFLEKKKEETKPEKEVRRDMPSSSAAPPEGEEGRGKTGLWQEGFSLEPLEISNFAKSRDQIEETTVAKNKEKILVKTTLTDEERTN